MIRSFFAFAILLFLAIPTAVVLIPFTLVTRNVRPLYAAGCRISQVAMRIGGVHSLVEGREQIPLDQACIFMANHISNLDPPALLPILPGRVVVFVKRQLMKIPLLGYALRLASFIPVDRDGQVESAQQAVAGARRVLAQGLNIMTFVEGTRSRDGRMLPFKKGPFYLAKESGALCVPVSIYGTETIFPRGSLRIRPGVVHIVFHPPIDPAAYATRDELSAAVRAAIASSLPEWMRSEGH